ncbi:MAG: DUF697 domain-containing protein [Methylococcaceae bacterium]|nr:DUF697 domain-containing protein [Methylococcaceae bacterium]
MSENEILVNDDKLNEAQNIVRTHTYYAMGAGLVPIPVFDFVAVTGIQIDMLRCLSNLYEIDFMENKGKNLLGALTGGGASSSFAPMLASTVKMIPFLGSILGAVSMPAIAGATTYAVGKVFIQHFEAGGTLLNFDPKAMKAYYAEQLKEGNNIAAKSTPATKSAIS